MYNIMQQALSILHWMFYLLSVHYTTYIIQHTLYTIYTFCIINTLYSQQIAVIEGVMGRCCKIIELCPLSSNIQEEAEEFANAIFGASGFEVHLHSLAEVAASQGRSISEVAPRGSLLFTATQRRLSDGQVRTHPNHFSRKGWGWWNGSGWDWMRLEGWERDFLGGGSNSWVGNSVHSICIYWWCLCLQVDLMRFEMSRAEEEGDEMGFEDNP